MRRSSVNTAPAPGVRMRPTNTVAEMRAFDELPRPLRAVLRERAVNISALTTRESLAKGRTVPEIIGRVLDCEAAALKAYREVDGRDDEP